MRFRALWGLIGLAGLLTGLGLGCARQDAASQVQAVRAPDQPFVIVNGQSVLQRQWDQMVDEIVAEAPPDFDPKRLENMLPEIRREARQQVILRTIMDQKVQELGIVPAAAQIEQEVADIDHYLLAHGSSLEQYLKDSGRTAQEVRDEVRQNLTYTMLYDRLLDLPEPTDQDVFDYYRKNQTQYIEPEAVLASRIWVARGKDVKSDRQQRLKIRQALDQLAAGENVASVARTYSEGPLAAQGGDLGWITRDATLEPDLLQAVFSQEVGKPGSLIELTGGYALVWVRERRPSRQAPLDEIKDVVRADLIKANRAKRVPALLQQMLDQAKIETPPAPGLAP